MDIRFRPRSQRVFGFAGDVPAARDYRSAAALLLRVSMSAWRTQRAPQSCATGPLARNVVKLCCQADGAAPASTRRRSLQAKGEVRWALAAPDIRVSSRMEAVAQTHPDAISLWDRPPGRAPTCPPRRSRAKLSPPCRRSRSRRWSLLRCSWFVRQPPCECDSGRVTTLCTDAEARSRAIAPRRTLVRVAADL
jgi:hypothetical protein